MAMEYFKLIPIGLLLVVFATCFVYAVIYWFKIVRHGLAVTRHYKNGVNRWGKETMYNPFNGMWQRHLLTAQGIEHANKCNAAILRFIIVIALPFFVGFLAELLTGVKLVSN